MALDFHEESIYNLIPGSSGNDKQKGAAGRGGKKSYNSKWKQQAVCEERCAKVGEHRTMGYADHPKPKPTEFLKKHEKEPRLNGRPGPEEAHLPHHECGGRHKPPVPTADDRPVLGMKTNKDFIHQNAVENIMSVPKKPQKAQVDTKHGDKQYIQPAGLEPVHIHRKDYGQVPEYLEKRKAEIAQAQEEYNRYVAEHFSKGQMTGISEEDRRALVCGLKANWDELNKEYQMLSVMIDTVPKKLRKERMENELKQLEKDIDLLEAHPVIYIADQPRYF